MFTLHLPFFFLGSKQSARMATVSVIAFSLLLTTGMLRKLCDAVPSSSDLEMWKLCLFSTNISVQ